ncbi:hypothetical protein CK203_112518 [Vitis vinifera]|uniref:Uncharacterized protein n=1 Tax=Vitis vinifera TaxID=29760 RepID=A0A438C9Y1_VITVI|nr:hypothetical protein CK203_112518 [Vitis vinifera]
MRSQVTEENIKSNEGNHRYFHHSANQIQSGLCGFTMGSTGEPDRKRRHFSSLSPTAATAKKMPFLPVSEDKKAWLKWQGVGSEDGDVLDFSIQPNISARSFIMVEILPSMP